MTFFSIEVGTLARRQTPGIGSLTRADGPVFADGIQGGIWSEAHNPDAIGFHLITEMMKMMAKGLAATAIVHKCRMTPAFGLKDAAVHRFLAR